LPTKQTSDWAFALRALGSRNYRLFFSGQSISLIGTWMTRIATAWLVYRLTGSAFLLGIVGFAGQVPAFFLAPIAGVWVDRLDRHRTLVVTQVLSMVQSFLLAWLALAGIITIWEIIALSVFQGLINSFDMPSRQAFVIQMIENRDDLGNAIALNSSMVNAARLVGPSIAGILIARVGEGYCFLIDGISYIAVIVSLLLMRIVPARRPAGHKRVLHELGDGFRYAFHFGPIRSVLLIAALVSLMGMPYSVLMPIFASNVLHGGPHTLGFLMAAAGLGALTGAVTLTFRRSVLGLGRVIAWSAAVFGAALIGFGLSHMLWLSLTLMVGVGFGMMRQIASCNTVLQTLVDEDKRGRVMSLYSMAFLGMTPFGSLLAGSLASSIGAPRTVMISGAACIAGGVWFWHELPKIRALARPIYARLGILPELATGVQTASALQTPPEN
jgi:MFS family permease